MTAGLLLPALFHGLYRDVKRRMARVVTQIRRGADWVAMIEDGGFLDVATTPGHIVIDGPSSTLGGEDHFHAYVLWRMAFERNLNLPAGTLEGILARVFEQSITTVWGTVGLLGQAGETYLIPRENHIPFLRAAVTCWDELDGVGRRYTMGQQFPDHLWDLPTTVGYVLANLGVPVPVLRSPLPPGGLLALIRSHGIDLTADGPPPPGPAGSPRR